MSRCLTEISLGDDFGDVAAGGRMADGTIYAGVSPDTNKPIFATPKDAPLTYAFDQAADYAAQLEANGHRDWRVPTTAELNVMFRNRAAIGGFNESGSDPGGWYWSSSEGDQGAWARRFSDGRAVNYYYDDYKSFVSSLRCVR